ncbi:ribosomal biogenesis regulatory protein [Sodiomyces alkalinus F11]|uniref:Ribosome biogenesis regulatory protein n=1 Tax=Sodiomyces alkalinus (strain CBS 110278 / VKM F-3762 / F11) TaxID=1314773 RepID=A0A3N2PS02_SODAK|nr:ribosomal biogenesis regulatory protein [Sodiomyces alkalinus F11]ROT37240.1 ribosomal biogenesis regulatory protein [Sodiomyces alkalinus F11]
MAASSTKTKLSVTVERPTPYYFDLGLLMTTDPNPVTIDASKPEQSLAEVARDGAQALINQLMTTCPITANAEGVLLTLPPTSTPIPREKPIPKPKEPTRWERFAEKRGIKPKTREQRRNLAYDEETGEWRPKWGFKGLNKKGEDDWLVEVDPEAEARRKEGTSVRMDGRRERKERVKRNDRRMRKNVLHEEKGRKA